METTHPDLWAFIKNIKATQAASLEVLQHFILSLDRKCLLHILEVYMSSLIRGKQYVNGLTLKQSVGRWITNPTADVLNPTDAAILHQVQANYGAKYDEQIVRVLKQNNIANGHLLTVNAEVFAYSLQFLSFKEVYATRRTCAYFSYITTSFRGLAHHSIVLDDRYRD